MITKVRTINWRAFDDCEFVFGPGITFLMGANGTGKTSVLEAISYGLTGEAALYTSKTRGRLLREPNRIATVQLTFQIDGQEYQVERSQSKERAADARLLRLGDQKILATNHSQATKKIENLMGVSADFLRRIVYMAEGDVFRFLDNPPQEALETQVRRVLGLTQLNEFLDALDGVEKKLKQQIASLQNLCEDLDRLQIRTNADLESHLHAGNQARKMVLSQLDEHQKQVFQTNQETRWAESIQASLDRVHNAIERQPSVWKGLSDTSIEGYFSQLEQKLNHLERDINQVNLSLAHLEGEKKAYRRIAEILEPYDEALETIPCPICRKPLTVTERKSILDEIKTSIGTIEMEVGELSKRRDLAQVDRQTFRQQSEILSELRNRLVHGDYPERINPDIHFNLLFERVSDTASSSRQDHPLDQKRQEIEDRLAELEKYQAEYLAIKNRLQSLGYNSPEEATESLVGLEIRAMSLRAASQAAQQTLITQRNVDMQSIYAQIGRLWEAFTGEGSWQIELNKEGIPTLQNELGQTFDMSQFSGGEKTALLIMMHTIIAHNFSNSDFLMIDEPLEHLDPINRRSLIRFLVQSYRRGIFKQAIVATFEESLIRKYMSEEGVSVSHI
jgi:DNA repair exonuclease SbcCD ATPase subunit